MSNKKSDYLFLFRGESWDKELTLEETERVMNETLAWFDRVGQAGKIKGCQPLANTGRIVSGRAGRTIADGPFAESKEAVAGYLIVELDSMEEAVAWAKTLPAVAHGQTVEVRLIEEECPTFRRVKARLAETVA